jgi:AbrB family looped-hinge helix DNA binding protein
METRVSTRGQVVLPVPLRRKLGIRAGELLDVSFEADRIILKRRAKPSLVPRIIEDPILGIPVLTFGPDAPVLTSERVQEILAEFP